MASAKQGLELSAVPGEKTGAVMGMGHGGVLSVVLGVRKSGMRQMGNAGLELSVIRGEGRPETVAVV